MHPTAQRFFLVILLPLFFSVSGPQARGQESYPESTAVRIVLTDGTVYLGRIGTGDSTTLVVTSDNGVSASIPRSGIASIGPLDGPDAGTHPARTRLFFTPTARPIDAGQGYLAVYELFFPFVGVGVTDFLSLAGGISIIPGADHQFVMFAPKISPIATDNVAAAAGLLYIGETDGDGVGILYTDMTVGRIDRSLTIGLGWGFSGSETSDRPVVLAGFQWPLGGGTELVSENWFPPNLDPAILSLGMRFSSGSVSADFAVWFPSGWDGGDAGNFIPWVSFAYGF
ncbi:MAG TPA: hypothetical protein VI932_08885 [Bacteroidota bacterium]|nr:hypothetical protein [Bacteroidota bacterium]